MYLGQLPGTTTPTTTTKPPTIAESITAALPGLVQAYQQRKIFKVQMQRAEQGLPPLDVEQYAPAVRVQAGIDLKTLLPIAVPLGILALVLVMGRRRR